MNPDRKAVLSLLSLPRNLNGNFLSVLASFGKLGTGKRAILVAFLVFAIPLVALALTFTTIDVPGSRNTAPQGINARGDIIGFSTDNTTSRAHGFLLSHETFTEVNIPGFLQTAPRAMNDRGDIVGQVDNVTPTSTRGFLLEKDGTVTLVDFPGAPITGVFGINNAGQMVGN